MDALLQQFFNLDIMARALPLVLQGLQQTILLCLIVIPLGLIGGLIFALASLSSSRTVRWGMVAASDVFRAVGPRGGAAPVALLRRHGALHHIQCLTDRACGGDLSCHAMAGGPPDQPNGKKDCVLMPRPLRVAAAQSGPIQKAESRQAVVKRLTDLLDQAHADKVDFVVFTELALTTFFPRWYMTDQAEVDSWFEREMPNAATRPLFEKAAQY